MYITDFTWRSVRRNCAIIVVLALLGTAQRSSAVQLAAGSLADLSLEELANIDIVSVSRRAERLSDAPASVFVITADDIRRSGATSLPEALRLAPNLQVAQASASGYAITSRGFNSSSANKLLVLIDGRSVYTPLFSGVFWDAQGVMLEDIDRIEVRVAWRPRQDLELSVTGQNLFDSGHGEFTDVSTRTEIGRSVFFKILSRF